MIDRAFVFPSRLLRAACVVAAIFLFVALGVLPSTTASAQTNGDADKIRQIDQLLTATYKPTDPGAVILIAKNGKPLLRKAYGMADVEKGISLKAEDVFRIGSVTKSFTAMAILLLEEEGKLSVKDEIKRFLPDYPMQGHKITIEHLLTHTSGVAIYTDMPNVRNAVTLNTPREVIDLFKNAPMLNAPGEQFVYNNSGYYLLGAVIEKVSGMSYADFIAKRIFTPLGMHNTAYEGRELGGSAKRIAGYRAQDGRYTLAPDITTNLTFSAGGLVSTADDLNNWQNAMASEKLLKPATWKRSFTPATLNNGTPTEYGYGWFLRKLRGQPMREHGGVIAGFQAMVVMLPQEQLSLVFLTNQQARQNVALRMGEQINAMVIGKPFPELKPKTLADEVLAQFEGVYQLDGKPARTVTRFGKGLRQQTGNSQRVMHAFTENEFFQPDGSFTRYRFERNAAGKVTRMIRIDSGDEEEVYARVGELPAQQTNAAAK
jgi:D-alanyl-D-alanine carboxypeptidase